MMHGIKNTSNDTFSRLMGNGLRYNVPKYQRDYSWDKEQWSDLWYDVLQMIEDQDSHYMGYLVLQTNDDKNYQIIDGQQRLTTLCILILAVVDYLKKLPGTEEERKANEMRAQNIHTSYIGNLDMLSLTSVNKLVLNRNNDHFYKTYLSALQKMPKRGLNASEKLLKSAFESFSTYLVKKFQKTEELINFVDNLVNNIFFTVITVTDELNAFKVFETLNARGVQLSSSDLLKNYIFSVANTNDLHQTKLDELENIWAEIADILKDNQVSEFLRFYWNCTHKTIRKNQLYKTIRNEIKTPEAAFSLLRDMRSKADIFMALKNPSDELWRELPDVAENLHLLNLFNVVQPIPLLMTAYVNLPEKIFSSLLAKIIVITFRYNIICGKNPNEQENVYNKIALTIEETKSFDIEELKSGIYIPDEEFERIFIYKEFVYTTRNNKIAKYILGKIEKFETSADVDTTISTLEHILPDNPNETWDWEDIKINQFRYRLGNMTLLEAGKNKDLGNASFAEKKEVYKTSTVPMTSKIGNSDIEEWTEENIEIRQREMAKKAKGIWKI